MMMHKIFGEKTEGIYYDRNGAYLILKKGNKVGVVQTKNGLFLLGGGIEKGETDEQCLIRESLEESGYEIKIGERVGSAESYLDHPTIGLFHPIQVYYRGELIRKIQQPTEPDHQLIWLDYNDVKGKMVARMQNWAIEQVFEKPED